MAKYRILGTGKEPQPIRSGSTNGKRKEHRYKSLTSGLRLLDNLMGRFKLEFDSKVDLKSLYNAIVKEAASLGESDVDKSVVNAFDDVYATFFRRVKNYEDKYEKSQEEPNHIKDIEYIEEPITAIPVESVEVPKLPAPQSYKSKPIESLKPKQQLAKTELPNWIKKKAKGSPGRLGTVYKWLMTDKSKGKK